LYCRFGGVTDPPISYDYGSSVVINDNNVYVNGEQTATAEQYTEQATTFADRGRDANPAANDGVESSGAPRSTGSSQRSRKSSSLLTNGRLMRNPSVESPARTTSGAVMIHGDSCGS